MCLGRPVAGFYEGSIITDHSAVVRNLLAMKHRRSIDGEPIAASPIRMIVSLGREAE